MKEKLLKKGVDNDRISVITDWADIDVLKPVVKKDNHLYKEFGLDNKFLVMYSGNLGLSQDFESILKAISQLDNNINVLFVGEGSGKDKLQYLVNKMQLTNINFFPYQPYDQLSFSLSVADLHLVPLLKGVAGSIVPSKVYGIMSVAKPYLAIADENSEPVYLAKKYNCGLWAEPGDVEKIVEQIKWSVQNRKKLREMGKSGRKVIEESYDKNKIFLQWDNLIASVLN